MHLDLKDFQLIIFPKQTTALIATGSEKSAFLRLSFTFQVSSKGVHFIISFKFSALKLHMYSKQQKWLHTHVCILY